MNIIFCVCLFNFPSLTTFQVATRKHGEKMFLFFLERLKTVKNDAKRLTFKKQLVDVLTLTANMRERSLHGNNLMFVTIRWRFSS